MTADLRLRHLPFAARLGLTGAVLVLALGAWTSALQIPQRHARNDGIDGLSYTDVLGAYHGVEVVAPLRAVLAADDDHAPDLTPEERAGLVAWLEGDSLLDGYDAFDLDDMAPAFIVERRCVSCHAAGSGVEGAETVPLEYWDQVERVVQDKQITPTPWPILLTSIHTHATSIGTLVAVVGLLACCTRFWTSLRSLPLLLGGVGLLADLGGQLLARTFAPAVWGVLAGGATFGLGLGLGFVLITAELWLPSRAPSNE
ncbi:MAG: hypothetical protein AAFZ65_16410 [Planctomycetota bacterium]